VNAKYLATNHLSATPQVWCNARKADAHGARLFQSPNLLLPPRGHKGGAAVGMELSMSLKSRGSTTYSTAILTRVLRQPHLGDFGVLG
jgi:hypothetical protein